MSNLLLDSHTLLWTLYEPHLLTPRVRSAIEDPGNHLFISQVSVLELTDKVAKFRLPTAGFFVDRVVERIEEIRATIVPIEMRDILASVKLPRHHNEPLDRLLIAQAERLDATLLSKDGKFKLYDVPLLWT